MRMIKKNDLIKNQVSVYQKAVERFLEAVKKDDGNEFMQDSILQRFEFCIELARKTGKKILERQGYYDLQFPKQVFQVMHSTQMIKDIEIRNNFLEYRNILSHCYGLEIAYDIANTVKKQYKYFQDLSETFKSVIKKGS